MTGLLVGFTIALCVIGAAHIAGVDASSAAAWTALVWLCAHMINGKHVE